MDDALRHIIGVHGARMYYNLTNIHTVLRTGALRRRHGCCIQQLRWSEWIARSVAAGLEQSLREFVELVVIAVKTSWLYLFLGRRVRRSNESLTILPSALNRNGSGRCPFAIFGYYSTS
jgi:hypothetical protein